MSNQKLEQDNAELRRRLEEAEKTILAISGGLSSSGARTEQLAAVRRDLQSSEDARRFAMQAAGAGLWTWDAGSGLVTWSKETYDLFGVDPGTPLLYDSWRNAVHPDDRERADAAAGRAMESGRDLTVDYRIQHPTRGERWLSSIGRIIDPVNRPGYMTGISIDITASKQAEQALRESEQRFRRMADTLPVLIWVSDVTKACTWFNQCWLDFCGRPMEALVGDGWAKDVHPDDLARCVGDYAANFDARRPFVLEYRLRRHDGEYRWVEDTGTPWLDSNGEFVGYIGSCVDFTERKLADDKLRHLAAELAEAGRRKDEFLAMLAHELRNPLAPIHNAVQLLRLADVNPQRVQQAAGMLERQVGQMVRLVDDLLDVNRISRGKIELRRSRTELASFVNHAAEAARLLPQSLDRELLISLPPEPIFVNGDPIRLAQVVGNLLTNAYKFTERGGRVRVTVERDGDEAVIRVEDDGIGIAADQLTRIFDMFAQVDSSLQRPQSGLGIGLTLARRLIELHGGTVRAHSRGIGHGSEFVVRLPALPDPKDLSLSRPAASSLATSAPSHVNLET
jgi:PAS domain S-box-containing protein